MSNNLVREAKALLPSQPSETIAEDQIDGFLEQLVWTDPLLRKVLQAGDMVWVSIEVSRVFATRDLRGSAVVASSKNGRTLPDFSQQTN